MIVHTFYTYPNSRNSYIHVSQKCDSINCHLPSLPHQDIDGSTPLHAAVIAHRNEAVTILLDAGADPARYNNDFFTPILEAAKNGFYAYVFLFCFFTGSIYVMLKRHVSVETA